MKAKHTGGGWQAMRVPDDCIKVLGFRWWVRGPADGKGFTNIANVSGVRPVEEQEGNALLLAAAPGLLAACKARLECDEVFEQGTSEWHQAVDCADCMMREAIEKASGS